MGRAIVRGWVLLINELTAVLRQPMLVLALVLGPFLILLVFALGHRSQQPPLTMVLVVPSTVDLSRDLGFWRDRFGEAVRVVVLTDDEAAAREAVVGNQVDLALIIPASAFSDVSNGKQVIIRVLHNQINPVDQAYTGFVAYILSSELNKQIITEAARQAQVDIGQAREPLAALRGDLATIPNLPGDRLTRINSDLDRLDRLIAHLQSLAPGLLAAPVATRVESASTIDPSYVAFYSPGVLALLLQHVAITLASLSIVRDRLIGVIELYKVAPTSTFLILFGKYVSYGLVCLGVGAALTFLLLRVIGVPLLGDPLLFTATAALLVAASLGIGFNISLLSTSQENAVQLTMLVLLASVFFSGFFLPVTALQAPATEVSFVLPVRHAITALQDLMLRGELRDRQPLLVLGGMSVLFLFSSIFLLHRELRRA
jgi:ABC-2 type transport system permease protein